MIFSFWSHFQEYHKFLESSRRISICCKIFAIENGECRLQTFCKINITNIETDEKRKKKRNFSRKTGLSRFKYNNTHNTVECGIERRHSNFVQFSRPIALYKFNFKLKKTIVSITASNTLNCRHDISRCCWSYLYVYTLT